MTGKEDDGTDEINILLPDEIILQVFQFLPLESLLDCENVCFRWRKLARDQSVWRDIVIVYSGKPGQTEVSEKNLEILGTHSDYINCIKLQYVYNYPFIASVIKKCNNLTSIELVMCRVSIDFPDDLKRWPNLKKLSLKNSLLLQTKDNIEADMLIMFDFFKDLTFLALADFGLTPANCSTLLGCKYLSHILIDKVKGLRLDDIRDLILSKQRNLITFHIYGGSAVDDKCMQLLSRCPFLNDLAIVRADNLTDAGFLPLANLTQLEHLQIWNNSNITEMALLSTLGSPNMLKMISLSFSRVRNISPVIVDLISEHYIDIKFLAVYQCPRIVNTDYEKQLKSKFRKIDVVLY